MRVYFATPEVEKLRSDHMLVDMHFHSAHSHDCRTPVPKIIARCRELGVRIVLTDHNTISGVLEAYKLGGEDVIMPGVEITTSEGKDVIPYFRTLAELQEFWSRVEGRIPKKSSIRMTSSKLPMTDLLDELSKTKAVICLPHPFAVRPRRSYVYFNNPRRRPLLKHIHVFEVINQTMLHKQNLAAIGWAMQFNKAVMAGSDGHTLDALGTAFTVGQVDSWPEFLDALVAKQVAVIGRERRLHHQMLDGAKNATRILATKANILRRRKL